MKKLVIPLIIVLTAACGVCKPTPQNPTEQTIVHYVDSVRWHDSTVVSYLEKERYVDMVKPLDTLKLETSYARSEAYLDTAFKALRGYIENKSDVPVKVQIKWKERIVYRDNIQIKEVPVPYEVVKEVVKYPATYWWFLCFSIIAFIYFGIKIYLKIKL